jgi:hypothetical protein
VILESVFLGSDRELLPQLFRFYSPLASVVRDVTANTRKMWKGSPLSLPDLKFYDIDPAVSPDVVCDFGSLPDSDGSVCVLVYDPPHLPLAAASAESHKGYVAQYGLGHSVKGDNVAAHRSLPRSPRRRRDPE